LHPAEFESFVAIVNRGALYRRGPGGHDASVAGGVDLTKMTQSGFRVEMAWCAT
jgi:hypothetical protein